ncbi:MAG: class I SAM-dependent methyltransferase [Candidatus Stygibacter australis]|nr:class I SAM-dependent methyltransferase [Candidatus Stygibacter australis]MDP8321385.1 class I SAM-dependent methyltransferase [Candidatus Stygibacter australis]
MEKIIKQYQEVLSRFKEQKSNIHRLWNIDEESAHLLFMLVLIHQAKYILEIGTSNGYSTFWLAAAARKIGGAVHTIEVDVNRYNLAKENLKGFTNIDQYLAKAEDILKNFKPGIDFLFIDAGKPSYIEYIKLLEDKLAPQAVVIADNICSHPETTASYKKYIENNPAYHSMVHDIDAGLQIAYYQRY